MVRGFARANSLKVLEASSAKRSVVLSGTVAQFSDAFNVSLARYVHPDRGVFRGRIGPIYLSPELAPMVRAVLGLDNRPQALAHIRIRPMTTAGVSYTPPQVAGLYDFPSGLDGFGSIGRHNRTRRRVPLQKTSRHTARISESRLLSGHVHPGGRRFQRAHGGREWPGCGGSFLISRSRGPLRPKRRSSSTSRPTPTRASWTPSVQRYTVSRGSPPSYRLVGAARSLNGRLRASRLSTRPSRTPRRSELRYARPLETAGRPMGSMTVSRT